MWFRLPRAASRGLQAEGPEGTSLVPARLSRRALALFCSQPPPAPEKPYLEKTTAWRRGTRGPARLRVPDSAAQRVPTAAGQNGAAQPPPPPRAGHGDAVRVRAPRGSAVRVRRREPAAPLSDVTARRPGTRGRLGVSGRARRVESGAARTCKRPPRRTAPGASGWLVPRSSRPLQLRGSSISSVLARWGPTPPSCRSRLLHQSICGLPAPASFLTNPAAAAAAELRVLFDSWRRVG